MKPTQQFLKKFGPLERLRNSALRDLYWRVADRPAIEKLNREVEFYRQLLAGLGKDLLIVDVGANHGDKTDIFLKLGATVVAVEPDQSNQELLKRRFLDYRLSKKPVTIVGKALSDRSAVETMWIYRTGGALNTLSRKWVDTLTGDSDRFGRSISFKQKREVETTTLEDLFEKHGVPAFVKIDVEGYELTVLRGMKRSVPFLSFEANLPEFRSEAVQCIDLLRQLKANGEFNFAVDIERGLVLDRWLGAQDFARVFEKCDEKSVEIFWRTAPGS